MTLAKFRIFIGVNKMPSKISLALTFHFKKEVFKGTRFFLQSLWNLGLLGIKETVWRILNRPSEVSCCICNLPPDMKDLLAFPSSHSSSAISDYPFQHSAPGWLCSATAKSWEFGGFIGQGNFKPWINRWPRCSKLPMVSNV